ncbi:von Willebrand factor type A domain-containing protein [Plantactinospora sp. GCM10030261]|uniref:vWA domain-containing protein n=1 Tax=Plantactinospora sp. GCM10030261 TaxID=3273420 RepID=UPI0036105377
MAITRRIRRPGTVVLVLTALVATAACGSSATPDGADRAGPPAARHTGAAPPPATGGETETERDAESTFALDVDTASYGYARRLITEGRMPEPTAVRPEEFVNSFAQDYPEPAGDGFAIHVDGSRLPEAHRSEPAGDVRLMRVGLRTRAEDGERRPDVALTFVVDVSGSMSEPGRLDLVQDALHTLVDRLRPSDSVAIVAFSSEARTLRGMTRAADADRLHAAVADLRVRSSTNLEAGLTLGYEVAREGFRPGATNRVILLSDGLANVGSTTADPILRQVREQADKQITLLGVGVGSEYGDALMERLADRGDGMVVYVSQRDQARDVFARQLPATLSVRALDAKAQVSFDPATVRSYRLIGYDNRAVADEDFRDDRVDGGEIGPGHSVTALYAVRLTDEADRSAPVARVHVRWLDPTSRAATESDRRVIVGDLSGDFDRASPRLWTCYAAAYFAEVLRTGSGGHEVSLDGLAGIAREAADSTGDAAVRDLAEIIDRARELD